MNYTTNKYSSTKIEFHILQSFPVTCLNRDDAGAPKTAVIGDTIRARVSSQCWKRPVRMAMHDMEGIDLGMRTKMIKDLIARECKNMGATDEQACACGDKIEKIFIKDSDKKEEKSDTLLFFGPSEITKLAEAFKEKEFDPDETIKNKDIKKQAKEVAAIIGKPNFDIDGLDIALFGRMVAQASELDVEGAVSFSHAISTHEVSNDIDFFTALDDFSNEQGSAHMGCVEFNSAVYYRYISIDLGQLVHNMGSTDISKAIEAFTKALFLAVPVARQNTMSGASPWEYAKVLVRDGQRLQVPFEETVESKGSYLEPSKEYLNEYLDNKEKQYGSLFNKIAEFTYGEDKEYSIDKLTEDIKNTIKE